MTFCTSFLRVHGGILGVSYILLPSVVALLPPSCCSSLTLRALSISRSGYCFVVAFDLRLGDFLVAEDSALYGGQAAGDVRSSNTQESEISHALAES